MNIFSLTRINSLPLNSQKKTKTMKITEKFSRIKSILFLILHMISYPIFIRFGLQIKKMTFPIEKKIS